MKHQALMLGVLWGLGIPVWAQPTVIADNTQARIEFFCTSAPCTVLVSESSALSGGVLANPVNDTNETLFPGSTSATRNILGGSPSVVDPANSTHIWFVAGGRVPQFSFFDSLVKSRSLAANTQHYVQIIQNGVPGAVTPFTTGNVPGNETHPEEPFGKADGSPLVPFVPDVNGATIIDHQTGVKISSLGTTSDNPNGIFLFDGAGHHMCSTALVGPTTGPDAGQLGMMCNFPSPGGTASLYWYSNTTKTWRFLGLSTGPATWPSCDGGFVNSQEWGTFTPKTTYTTLNYHVSGPCDDHDPLDINVPTFVRVDYTDTAFTELAAGTSAGLLFTNLTPPGHTLGGLLQSFNASFDPSLFSVNVQAFGNFAYIEARRTVQGSYGWWGMMDMGDSLPLGSCTVCMHVIALTFGPTNIRTRWDGTHSGGIAGSGLSGGTFINVVTGTLEGCSVTGFSTLHSAVTSLSPTIVNVTNKDGLPGFKVGQLFSIAGDGSNTAEWFLPSAVAGDGSGNWNISVTGAQNGTSHSLHSNGVRVNFQGCDPYQQPASIGLGPYAMDLTSSINSVVTTIPVATAFGVAPNDGNTPSSLSNFNSERIMPNPVGGNVGFQVGDYINFCGGSHLSVAITSDTQTTLTFDDAIPNIVTGSRIYLYDTANSKVETVRVVSGSNPYTVTRGEDGSLALVSLPIGARVAQDYNQCNSPNEYALITGINPMTVTRATPRGTATAWPAGSFVVGIQGIGVLTWGDGEHSPTLDPAHFIIETDNHFAGGHTDFCNWTTPGPNVWEVIEPYWSRGPSTSLFAQVSTPAVTVINPDVTFDGVSGFSNGNTATRYPTCDILGASVGNQTHFYDFPQWGDGGGFSGFPGETPVGGTTQLYKYIPGSLTWPPTIKVNATVAKSGQRILTNVSGPSSTIVDGSPGQFTWCLAYAAGECRGGSAAGDAFANIPDLDTNACSTNENGTHLDLCIGNNSMSVNAVLRFNLNPPATGIYAQRISSGLIGYNANHKLAKADAFDRFLFFRGNSAQMLYAHLGSNLQSIPWPTAPDSYDRTTFIPIDYTLPSTGLSLPAGTSTAKITFGYLEYSGNCTSRNELCTTVSATIPAAPNPFSFDTADAGSYTRMSCAAGCTIRVPALSSRVMYAQAWYYDSGGTLLRTDNLAPIVVAPTAFVPPIAPSNNPSSTLAGKVIINGVTRIQ